MKWWTFVDIWTMFIVHWKCKWWCKTLQRLERSSEVEEAIAEENESFQSEKEVACFAVISVIMTMITTAGCGRMHPTLHWSRHWLRDGKQAEDALPCRPPAQVPQQLPLMFFKALHETFKETWSMTTGHWLVTLNVKYFGIAFSRLNHSGESLQDTLKSHCKDLSMKACSEFWLKRRGGLVVADAALPNFKVSSFISSTPFTTGLMLTFKQMVWVLAGFSQTPKVAPF